MSNKKRKDLDHNPDIETTDGSDVNGAVEQPEEETTDNVCNSKEDTATLSAEIAELKAKLEQAAKDKLLAMADFDNYRKRTLKEKADLIKSGGEECLKNLLPVIDDFERGLEAINSSNDAEAIKEGVSLIYNKFKSYLQQQGVQEINTDSADFDTEYHEAVTTFPVQDPKMKGKVVDCIQKGYIMNGKVIRFAKVVVGE